MPGSGLGNQQQQQHTEALRAPVVSARSAWIARSRCDGATCCMPFSLRTSELSAMSPSTRRLFGGHVRYASATKRRVGETGPGEFGAWVLVT
ncbi:Uncharacterised protein [Mycobacteroides abscessus]|nr:Uncharacterised protein [Mycobacteroides abscessus]